MKEEEKDIFYVNLATPVEVKRAILESTKNTLSCLKRYESFRKIREYRAEHIIRLNHVMGEIRLLNNRLKRVLPSTGLRAVSPKKEKQVDEKAEPPKSNLNTIEDELKEIESRLKHLE